MTTTRRRGRKAEEPPRQETAAEALERVLREESDAEDAALRSTEAARERAFRERREREQRDRMAAWEVDKVRALIAAGQLDAAGVRLWAEARAERLRRAAHAAGIVMGAALTGRAARLVRCLDGEVVVEVLAPGEGPVRSTWNGGLYGEPGGG